MNLMRIDPVYVYESTPEADDDIRFSGSLFLKEKPEGIFVEWKINDNSVVTFNPKNNLAHHKFMVNFNIYDLKSVKEARSKTPACKQLTFILKCGSTLPTLHLPIIECENIINQLQQHIPLVSSLHKDGMYIVRTKKTFEEFDVFGTESDVDGISHHHQKILTGFTKVTKYLHERGKDFNHIKEQLIGADKPSQGSSVSGDYKNLEALTLCDNGSEFEFITPAMKEGDLAARPNVFRGTPITAGDWISQQDVEGRIVNPGALKQLIFRRGVDGPIRQEVWKFLLGYYRWDSTSRSRVEQRKDKITDYSRMKVQWKSINEDQLLRFSSLRDCKSLIEKDVLRTDRNHKFFEGCNNPNLPILQDILLTHCMYDFDLGYVQGMSDLLAPILVIMEHEEDAFWSFAGFIKLVSHNFEKDQQSMKNQLSQLQFLIKCLDPEFSAYLEKHNSLNMYFCFRWLLIIFKREFSFPDAMRLWEVLWTGLPCQNFHLLICLAILETSKDTLIENDFGFTEILKLVNDMSGRIDVEEVLKIAEGMFIQLSTSPTLSHTIKHILGLDEYHDFTNESPFHPFSPFDDKSLGKVKADSKASSLNSLVQSPVDASSHRSSPISQGSDKLGVSGDYSHLSNPSKPSPHMETGSLDYANMEVLDPFSAPSDLY